jgi:hypothetical protein
MLVVVPVSSHDSELIEDFCDILNFFSPYKNHDLLVVSRPSDISHSQRAFESIKGVFRSAKLYTFTENGPLGWPQGPNFYWHQTITYLRDSGNLLPWFWMEMDITPIEEGWLEAFETEYSEAGKKCLGVIQPNVGATTSHLVGIAVYPPDISSICDSWVHVYGSDVAFDVACQHELVPESANSKLLQHNFRTRDYRCTNLGFRGIDVEIRQNGVRFDKLVQSETMLVHGCTDGSLARLILNKDTPRI